jgi:hypothetical protein
MGPIFTFLSYELGTWDLNTQLFWILVYAYIAHRVMFESAFLETTVREDHFRHPLDRIVLSWSPSFTLSFYAPLGSAYALLSILLALLVIFLASSYHLLYQFHIHHTLTQHLRSTMRYLTVLVSLVFALFYLQLSALAALPALGLDLRPHTHPALQHISSDPLHLFNAMQLFPPGYGPSHDTALSVVGPVTNLSNVRKLGERYPSVVARREVVLEGFDDLTQSWLPILFKHLPSTHPSFTPHWTLFPHQPRLDWRMTLAAASESYTDQPWLLSLMVRLLQGDERVVATFLDEEQYPFHTRPPSLIRSLLYEYDLTRLDSYWARNFPVPPPLAATAPSVGPLEEGDGAGGLILVNVSVLAPWAYAGVQRRERSESLREWRRSRVEGKDWRDSSCPNRGEEEGNQTRGIRWWYKRLVGEYSPPIHLQNASLSHLIESHRSQLTPLISSDQERAQCVLTPPSPSSFSAASLMCDIVFEMRSALRGGDEDEEALWIDYWILIVLVVVNGLVRMRYNLFAHYHYDLEP